MRRFGKIVVLACGLALSCVPDAHAKDQKGSDEPSEPAVAIAQKYTKMVEKAEIALDDVEQELISAVESFRPGKFEDAARSVSALREFISELSKLGKTIVENQAKYTSGTAALKEALLRAIPAYKQAAEVYKTYAAEEKIAEFKAEYLELSKTWLELAALMETRAKELDVEPAQVAAAVQYIERGVVLLDRWNETLAAFPTLESVSGGERYREQMQRFMKGLNDLRGQFRIFNSKLRSGAVSDLRTQPDIELITLRKSATAIARPGTDIRAGQVLPVYRPYVGKVAMVQVKAKDAEGYWTVETVDGTHLYQGDGLKLVSNERAPTSVAKR